MRNVLSEFPLVLFNIYDHILFKLHVFVPLDNPTFSVIIITKNSGDDSETIFFLQVLILPQRILTVASVSTGGVVCLQWEWNQLVIHD